MLGKQCFNVDSKVCVLPTQQGGIMPAFISLQQYRAYACPVWLADTNGVLPLTVPVCTDGFKNATGRENSLHCRKNLI